MEEIAKMLKPTNHWKWCFDKKENALFLSGLADGMAYQSNIPTKLLVDCALCTNEFTVDDAANFNSFKESTNGLPLSQVRQDELILACVAIRRFHKPVQPKSWFFDFQGVGYAPEEGELVYLKNSLNQGLFVVVESGENASVCISVDLEGFFLNGSKLLPFCHPIKVMHDRLARAELVDSFAPVALVG